MTTNLDQHRANRRAKFTILSFAAIFFTYTFFSFNFNPNIFIPNNKLKSTSPTLVHNPILVLQEEPIIIQQYSKNLDHLIPKNQTLKNNQQLPQFLDIFNSNHEFETRVDEFFKHSCKLRFFMTWIKSSRSSNSNLFGPREFLAMDALFKSNPDGCLIILSNTMDSDHGFQILKPVIDLGFRVQAIEPDYNFLFKNTPAKNWYKRIKNGSRDPGEIPLAQNLSNLIRLVVLYRYGGVYLDTDFIPLNDFNGLRNSIGAQSVDQFGNWTRLNNAVLVFDKKHPLLYRFIEEFASTFDGNRWGFNGPYLVSRVVERGGGKLENKFSVLPPAAFYPVGWGRIGGLFRRPVDRRDRRWVEAKVVKLKEGSYGVHLWNKQSKRLRIEEESIVARLVSEHCVVCSRLTPNF
ncbi:hypothetical protein SSX86_010366 [Deinandra increscens subsp. villosa]|uniref:Alpha 1,4-glycosyltransferase domain-containing protein n=1 Tax=Deinandra increscens subsp. villosa TaxID=3103831 RepID=A0AAP0DF48_9ASTR